MQSKRPSHPADDEVVWFKSRATNGYAWLSNFWPSVPHDAKQAVYTHLPILAPPTGHAGSQSDADERARFSITIDNLTYPTVEHYYHTTKYPNHPHIQTSILTAPTALTALQLNILYKHSPTDDSDSPPASQPSQEVLCGAMLVGLRCKFGQCEVLRGALLGTGERWLAEMPDGRRDSMWTGKKGELGKLLMQVRAELRCEEEEKKAKEEKEDGAAVRRKTSKDRDR